MILWAQPRHTLGTPWANAEHTQISRRYRSEITQSTLREHSENTQRTFKEHSLHWRSAPRSPDVLSLFLANWGSEIEKNSGDPNIRFCCTSMNWHSGKYFKFLNLGTHSLWPLGQFLTYLALSPSLN